MFSWNAVVVGFVCVLINFIHITSQYFVLIPAFGGFNVGSIAILLPFNFLVILLWINYILAIKTDPGRVPTDWVYLLALLLIVQKPNATDSVIQVKKKNAEPRFCRICKVFKPPRSHHCSECQRYLSIPSKISPTI